MSLLTDELRAMVGREVTYTAPEPLGAAAIRYFARAIGDDNPLYTDASFARAHGYDGVIAPPTLVCESNAYADLPRGPEGYAGHEWRLPVPGTRLVRGGNSYTFHRAVGPDDVITATWRIAAIEEKTRRDGSTMLVVTSVARYTDQHGDPLADNEELLVYLALPGAGETPA